jgi:hypothetical protein
MLDIINDNSKFIKLLYAKKIKNDEISTEALNSHYVHFYYEQITQVGFLNFMYMFSNDIKLIENIEYGLHTLKCFKHLEHFNKVTHIVKKIGGMHNIGKLLNIKTTSKNGNIFNFFDKTFLKIEQKESLIAHNYKWLMNHPNLQIISSESLENKIIETQLDIMNRYKIENPKHVKIIKELCQKVNMKYQYITAGDPNNIYNSSWYFKTASGYYFMIEKNKKAKMFSSRTKSEVATISTEKYYLM